MRGLDPVGDLLIPVGKEHGHGGGTDLGRAALVGGVVPQQIAQMAVRDVLVVGTVLDARGGDARGAFGDHREHEQWQQHWVQQGQDRGGGDELAESGDESLGVADQVLGRLRAAARGLQPVGEAGPVVRLQLDPRGSREDLEVCRGGDFRRETRGGIDGERIGPRARCGSDGDDDQCRSGCGHPLGHLPALEQVGQGSRKRGERRSRKR
ncbi:hypothetical protein EAO75_43780 [Streptomyces sp. uw30]|uniref:hypothetical protein n=1 Tax=Streptomyces sp. uw30 TaxID=1828179 RepID=UPI0011CDC51C|nr:hypothetical protein [Streptomyces sp. uw30]TXS39680.1 hypothetical protein EAO75_43780 [Streptomyces sp. uw30]